ncbi:MAG: preprotein translocase subunit SecY [Candidatus Hadarchaeota archaeon]
MVDETSKPRSRIYILEPVVKKLPEVAVPKRHISFKEKFLWTGLALLLFFIMSQIPLYGIPRGTNVGELLGQLKYVFASQTGTLMELGIGPIVTAGIILQLLVGSKIIGLNLSDPDDRAVFTGAQKLLAIVMGIFEGSMLVLAGRYGVFLDTGPGLFILFQLALGSIIVIYLDEIVSKYGFGSGVSLFIAGGVAMTVIWQALNPAFGVVPTFARDVMAGESFLDAFFAPRAANMMGLVATFLVFLIVVWAESVSIEIPLAYGKFGGVRGKYPIKFMYTSNIPVILAMTVFANLRIISAVTGTGWLVHYTTPPNGLADFAADPFRAGIYTMVLLGLAVGFAYLWVHMTGMGPRDVAKQLEDSGMFIPGHRRDPRVMEQTLGRYIMPAAVAGGAFVALLSAGADILGALGSGTGILLTVGIVHGLYEQMAREQVAEMFPAVRRIMGE